MKQVDVGQPLATSLPGFPSLFDKTVVVFVLEVTQVSDCTRLHRYQTFFLLMRTTSTLAQLNSTQD